MYNFQKQDSIQTLEEGLKEFYSINKEFKALAEKKDNPNSKVFKEHDYTHVLFGLGTSIEEESLLDSYTLWGTHWSWSSIWGFYKDPEYKIVIDDIISKYGGWWSIMKIYLSLAPVKFKVIKRCRQMTKKWNYHDIPNEVLNTPLKHLREEYNIELLSLDEIPINRYLKSQH